MAEKSKRTTCCIITWLIAVLAGVVVYKVCAGAVGWIIALLAGIALAVFLGLALSRAFCSAEDTHALSSDSFSGHSDTGMSDESTSDAATDSMESDSSESAGVSEETAANTSSVTAFAVKTTSAESDASSVSAEESSGATGSVAAADSAKAETTEDYDGDGVLEGTEEGTRPETLSAARDGKADDLKQIKGIGPKLEKLCNELGFYHLDQIASWTADEVAWVNANLQGFKGRVSRDNWVEQAKILAAGGETEFSKRVEDGKVY